MNSIWRGIRRWWSRFTWKIGKPHRNVVKIARRGSWFDHGYLMWLVAAKLNEMQVGFDSDRAVCVGASERAKQIRTAISLIEIVWKDKPLPTYININNVDRFAHSKFHREVLLRVPQNLYEEKAYHLLFKYLEHHLKDWWD